MPSAQAQPDAPTANEVPVTRMMLVGVRTEILQRIDQGREETRAEIQELRGEIQGVKGELKGDIHRLDASIHELRGEMHALKGELKGDIHRLGAEIQEMRGELKGDIHRLGAEIHELKAEVHGMKAGVTRIEVLVEEQNARNRIVLDGITAMLSRQNQVEQRVDHVEDTVRQLAVARSTG